MGSWLDAGEALSGPSLSLLDPFPFTREGRRYEAIEHELSLTQAVLKVGSLVLEKSAIRAKRRARQKALTRP
jgi:hypothetical protein